MFRSYLVIAWRNIVRSKAYSIINVTGLSLGVACCLLLALYIQDELSYDQYHSRLDDLYRVTTTFEGAVNSTMGTSSPPIANALSSEIPEVEFAARIVTPPGASQNLIRYKDKLFYEENGAIADSTLFNVLTYQFIEGDAAHALTDAHAVVITDELAKRLFGHDQALDQIISIQGVGTGEYKVTGVILSNTKTFLPVNFLISMNSSGGMADYIHSERVADAWAGQNFVPTFVRLSPGYNTAAVVEKMNQVLQKFGAEDLKARGMKKTLGLEPVKDIYLRSSIDQSPRITYLYVIASIAGFILLIAGINFINLSTARATKRASEIGVRKVMGAFRSSLIRQILSEAMVIVFIAIGIGVVAVQLMLPFFNQLTEKTISLGTENTGYFLIALSLLSIITGLLAGSYPAFYISSFQPAQVLKGKFNTDGASGWLRRGLVVFQFMIAITLMCGVIIISRQLNYMQEKDLGFDAGAKIILPLRSDDARAQYETLQNALTDINTIKAVSAAEYMPGSFIYSDSRLHMEGRTVDMAINLQHNSVDHSYMELLGIKLIAGRGFTDNRAMESERKAIINRTAAKKYGMEPEAIVGKHIFYEGQGQKYYFDVIGVMEDYHQTSLKNEIYPTMFTMAAEKNSYGLMVLSLNTIDFPQTLEMIERTWKKNIDNTPFEYSFLDEDIRQQYLADRKVSQIVTSFTLIALLISCLGLYGLSAFMAERRFKEIGIRKVLGATVSQIAALMSTEFVKLVLIAVFLSIPVAWYAMNKWLTGFAYHISVDVFVFVYAAAGALAIALLTVSFESIRAASTNPVKALKNE
ncbi:MAG TPA: ABC transporter permease [Chryseolinea sp.]|nr:ABC transporter permease [Chryseolinea sp.]